MLWGQEKSCSSKASRKVISTLFFKTDFFFSGWSVGADIIISDAVLLEAVFPNLKKKQTEELSDKKQKNQLKLSEVTMIHKAIRINKTL